MTFSYEAPSYESLEIRKFSCAQKQGTAFPYQRQRVSLGDTNTGKVNTNKGIISKRHIGPYFLSIANCRDTCITSEKARKWTIGYIYDTIKLFLSDSSSRIFSWMSLFVSFRVAPPLACIARYTSNASSCLSDSSCSRYVSKSRVSFFHECGWSRSNVVVCASLSMNSCIICCMLRTTDVSYNLCQGGDVRSVGV